MTLPPAIGSYGQPSKESMAQSIRSTYSWEASPKRMLPERQLVRPSKQFSRSSSRLCEWATAFSGPVRTLPPYAPNVANVRV